MLCRAAFSNSENPSKDLNADLKGNGINIGTQGRFSTLFCSLAKVRVREKLLIHLSDSCGYVIQILLPPFTLRCVSTAWGAGAVL